MIDEVADETTNDVAVPAAEPEVELQAGVHTGNDAVDAVLGSLERLPELPLAEHVTVFERAHEQLRAALDGPRD